MESKQISVLEHQFNPDVIQFVPDLPDYSVKIKTDEKGESVVVFEKDDNKALIESNGVAEDWSLSSLMKAGINPNFHIETSNTNNLETSREVSRMASELGAELPFPEFETSEN